MKTRILRDFTIEDLKELEEKIKEGYEELEHYEREPDFYDVEEIELLKNDLPDWEQELREMKYTKEFFEMKGFI